MNFCVAILILKMEENNQHFRYIMLYYFKKCKNAIEMQKKVCAGYGEGVVTDRTCPKWFAKFRAGEFSLDDAVPRSGRPAEVDSDQIQVLIDNNQHYTMWETANILKISKSIKLLVKMKNVPFFYRKNRTDFLANGREGDTKIYESPF